MKNLSKIAVFAFLTLMFSCTDPERATRTLEDMGYTDVETTGHRFGCSDSESTCTGFEATSPNGRHVEGVVGCGRVSGCSKGCTVRFD